MGKWIEQYKNHAIHETMKSISLILKNEEIPKDIPDVADSINRFSVVIKLLSNIFSKLNPEIATQSTLNSINGHLTRSGNELNQYISNKNIAHLTNANTHVDNALTDASQLHYTKLKKDADSFSDSILNFQSTADNIINSLEKEKENLLSEYKLISSQAKESNNKISELTDAINKQKERIDTIITDYQKQYSDSDEKRREQFSAQLTEQSQEFSQRKIELENLNNAFIEKEKDAIKTTLSAFATDAQGIINILEEKKKEASDYVQVIGNIGVTGNFKKVANEEQRAANLYRRIALGFMIGIFLVVGVIVFMNVSNGIDWKLILFRMSLALILAFPAWYASHESTKHRKNEIRNRRIELELASIDPYLEKLPQAKKDELKSKLTDRFFGKEDTINTKEDDIPKGIVEVLKLVIQKIPNK